MDLDVSKEQKVGDNMYQQLKKTLESLKRNKNKPDLHSFRANIKNGVCYVNYEYGEFNVDILVNTNCGQCVEHLTKKNVDDILKKLLEIEIDSNSIEI